MPLAESPIAIITGAGRGIGRAIAGQLISDGFHVVVIDLTGDLAEGTARELAGQHGAEAVAYQADVRDHARAHAIVAELIERYGRVDALINNAGIGVPIPFI